MRAGDIVRHRPTGEKWTVAYVQGDWLVWYGWPPGEARVSDCDLLEACSDEKHPASLSEWAKAGPVRGGDRRQQVCSDQLYQAVKGFVGMGI